MKSKTDNRNDSTELDRFAFHAVDQSRWPGFERLFESRVGPKSCWHVVWHVTS